MLRQLRKTAGSPESGLPASNINAADGYENQLSATAEMINTSSARGTPTLTLKVNPSLFSCVKISTESSEFLDCIAFSPKIRHGSTVTSSWAVAPFSGIAPAILAAAFHFGSSPPQIPARNLYDFWQRLNAGFSKQILLLGKRESVRTGLFRSAIVTQDFVDIAGGQA